MATKQKVEPLKITSAAELALWYCERDKPLRETKGKNRSPEIDMFNEYCGVPMGSPYCASGVSTCFHTVDANHPSLTGETWVRTAGSQAIKRMAKANGLLFKDPDHLLEIEGALFLWTNEGDPAHGHVGFVLKRYTSDGHVVAIQTAEFNTDPVSGDRDGGGAYSLKRRVPVDRKHDLWFVDTSSFIGGKTWS